MRSKLCAIMVGVTIAASTGGAAHAGSTPITTTRVAAGLSNPVYVTHAPNDLTRVFIVEQPGRIRILDLTQVPPVLIATPFLDINPRVTSSGSEQGLLGLTFHPDYAMNGYFYVNYTTEDLPEAGSQLGDTMVSRFQVSVDPDLADSTSEQRVLVIDQPQSNHNGGWIAFGPDGYLYVAMGDGGGADDNGTGHTAGTGNGQDITTNLLGKMLRLDVNGDDFPGDPNVNYAVPPSNPFVGITGDDEIWAWGLRNPWRNAFDRSTGDLYIADVGQNQWEEINFQPAASVGGENWGWRCREGAHNFNFTANCSAPGITLLDPIHEYSHGGSPFRCSITGGEVYRGCAIPDLQGTYFYADYCSDQIWSFAYTGGPPTVTDRTAELDPPSFSIDSVSGFGLDALGEMYICDHGGEVFKIIPDGAPDACICGNPPTDTDGDLVADCIDNCEMVVNAGQSNVDGDAAGDLCDDCPADASDSCIVAGSFAAEVNAAAGAMLAASDSSLALDIPPGGLSGNATISATRVPVVGAQVETLTDDISGMASLHVQHDLRPNGQVFVAPATLEMCGDVSAIPVDERAMGDICMAFLDGMQEKWDCAEPAGMPNCTVNEAPPGTFTLCCEVAVDHFSKYGLLTHQIIAVNPPLAAPAPHDVPKNRYVSFAPNNALPGVALRVQKTTAPTGTGWVGAPDGNGFASVVTAPVLRNWSEAVVHLGDCEIVPVATYEISATAGGGVFSAPVIVDTAAEPVPKFWGDTVGTFDMGAWTGPNGFVNANDFVAILQRFQALPTAPHTSVCDVQSGSVTDPCLNRIGNFADVFLVIKAFQGDPYPFVTDPALCPDCP